MHAATDLGLAPELHMNPQALQGVSFEQHRVWPPKPSPLSFFQEN